MLVVNQRRRHDFFGQLEEFLREGSRDYRRVFDEIGDLMEKP